MVQQISKKCCPTSIVKLTYEACKENRKQMNVNSSKVEVSLEYTQTSQIEELEKNIVENGDSSSLIKKLAEVHFKEGNYLRALSCYLKLLSFDPENARTWNKLAVIFIKLEEHKSAIELSRIAHRLICKEMNDNC